MNFDLSDEQALFRAAVERFTGAGDVETIKRARRHPGGVDPARWRELAELGILALPASADRGGLGGDTVDCVVAAAALGRGLAPEPWLECGYLPLRLLHGLDGGAALSERIASGAARAAVAFAEPMLRYELLPRSTTAVRTGAAGWAVSGVKNVVFGGEGADLYLVTAVDEDGPAIFAIAADAVEARGFGTVDGGRATTLTLRDAAGERLGPALPALADAAAETRLIAGAEMAGLAHRLFHATIDYVRERRQFGRAIGEFQAVQHRLVEAYIRLEQIESTMWRAALADRDEDGRWRAGMAGAKAFIAENALHIGHEAIQLHGGMGMSDELSIGHAHKRLLLLSRLFGDVAADLALFARAA